MADLSRFKPRSGNVFENLGALRDQLRNEKTRERAEEMVGKPGGAKRDVLGNLKERPWWDKLDGLDQGALEVEVNNVEREVGIKDIIRPNKSIKYDSDGDGRLEHYKLGELGIDAPSWDTFKTKGEARAWVNQKVRDVVVRNRANKAGVVVPEGGFKKPGEQEAFVREALFKKKLAEEDEKAEAAQARKWGKRGGKGATSGIQSQGVSGLSTLVGEGATPEALMELGKYQAGQDLTAAEITRLRNETATDRDRLAFDKNNAIRERNHLIKLEEIKNAAAVLQREADNAHAITLHDLQHESNMEFFDKKKDAYEQERFMDYIQGGVNGLGSLFQLLWL